MIASPSTLSAGEYTAGGGGACGDGGLEPELYRTRRESVSSTVEEGSSSLVVAVTGYHLGSIRAPF